MTTVTDAEKQQFDLLRAEVKQDINLAIANFKIWLLVTVLSNVVLIGVPALYVFFSTTNTAQTALTMTLNQQAKLEERAQWISRTETRLQVIERQLQEKTGFSPSAPQPLPR